VRCHSSPYLIENVYCSLPTSRSGRSFITSLMASLDTEGPEVIVDDAIRSVFESLRFEFEERDLIVMI